MYITKSINADHEDLIHDVAYDFYGKRMATCSSDQKVKVWDQDEAGNWTCTATWKTHSGSVWKVTWAHPVGISLNWNCQSTKYSREGVRPGDRNLLLRQDGGRVGGDSGGEG